MPRRRNGGRTRRGVDLPESLLTWLNGKPIADCDEDLRVDRFFWWCEYEGGLHGLVNYAIAHDLMPAEIPDEVMRELKTERQTLQGVENAT